MVQLYTQQDFDLIHVIKYLKKNFTTHLVYLSLKMLFVATQLLVDPLAVAWIQIGTVRRTI